MKSGSAAAVLDFAVGQILRDDTALGALPAVLERLVSTFGLRAAVAYQPADRPEVLAMSPADSVDEALLARIGTLTASSPGVLLARSVPAGGQCLCALALIGDGDVRGWDDEVRATAHAVAAIVATQIRHAHNIARLERSHAALAGQTERLNHLITAAIPGVLITDEQGIVTNASESFGEMFGLTEPSQLAGTPAVAVMHHIRREFADPARFTRRIAAVVRARQPLTGEQIQAADGRTIEGDYWPVLVDGIPEAEAGRLFNRFVRASNARSAGLPGTGLGLSIVKVLTEMHGGRADVTSTLGHGSTFTVYLPGPEERA